MTTQKLYVAFFFFRSLTSDYLGIAYNCMQVWRRVQEFCPHIAVLTWIALDHSLSHIRDWNLMEYGAVIDTLLQFPVLGVEKVEMIGEREIDVLLLPFYQKWAELSEPGEQRKWTIPIVLPSGDTAAARRRNRAKQHSGYIGRESLCITPFGLYPASRISGRGPAGLGKPKLFKALSACRETLIDLFFCTSQKVTHNSSGLRDPASSRVWVSESNSRGLYKY